MSRESLSGQPWEVRKKIYQDRAKRIIEKLLIEVNSDENYFVLEKQHTSIYPRCGAPQDGQQMVGVVLRRLKVR